jgi:type IV fimbrial biogenesis protein FimT
MRRTVRPPSGLTLIEVVVALAILAILASLAVPQIGRMTSYGRMQSLAEQLAAELNDARHDAVHQARTLHLDLRAGRDWCWAVSAVPACRCGEAQPCQRRHVRASARNPVSIEDNLQLSFPPGAEARAQPYAVTLVTPYDERLRVTVTPMGRARICAPGSARAGSPAAEPHPSSGRSPALRPACS